MEKNNKAKDKGEWKGERRKEPRIKDEVKVKVKFAEKDISFQTSVKTQEFWAFTLEISAGGLRLLLPFELERGHRASMEIYLPRSKRVISLEAEVCWQQPSLIGGLYETGLEFKNFLPEDRLSLMEFIYLRKGKKPKRGGKG